jgi:hypothetical protein
MCLIKEKKEKLETETRGICTRYDNRTLDSNEEVIRCLLPMLCSIELNDLKLLLCQAWTIRGGGC